RTPLPAEGIATMFRQLLAAGVMATGIGVAGTATEAEAYDRGFRGSHGRHQHHDDHHHGGGRFHIQPYPYYGGHHHHHHHYHGPRYRHGGHYGRPWGGGYYGGRSGFFIGTDRFSLGIYR
ncbi:MAG TPA: hypothetical protein VF170_13155, partial [Planctomycetaceae bacterium]